MKTFKVKLKAIKTIAENTKFFVFEFSAAFTFLPGQFLTAKVAEKTFRSYTIASAASALPYVELVIKLVENGIGSTYFHNLHVGDEVEFIGPFGHFLLPDDTADKIFIATGAGIAPMRCFWQTIAEKPQPEKIHLFFGYRYEEEKAFEEEFSAVKGLTYELAVSQPRNPSFVGFRGRITALVRQKPPTFFTGKDIFLCGSGAMIEEMRTILTTEKAVPPERIFFERYF